MIENYDSIVKEIDEMLFFREIDELIKKHDTKKVEEKQKIEKYRDKQNEKQDVEIQPKYHSKEEIFEFPVRKVKKIITLSC